MELRLRFRDLEPADLSDLDWSGGPEHIRAVAEALEASYAGEVALVVGCLPNDRLVAMGGVDFRPSRGISPAGEHFVTCAMIVNGAAFDKRGGYFFVIDERCGMLGGLGRERHS